MPARGWRCCCNPSCWPRGGGEQLETERGVKVVLIGVMARGKEEAFSDRALIHSKARMLCCRKDI